jgi:arylsulfatase A-like enzyme
MKVKELIKKLQELDQNAIVVVTTDNFEQGNSKKQAKHIHEFKGEIVKKGFRDAFDGESYTSEVVRWDESGKIKFVQIT